MLQKLSSAVVVIGALRVNRLIEARSDDGKSSNCMPPANQVYVVKKISFQCTTMTTTYNMATYTKIAEQILKF